jgi:hypothetical protein
MGINLTIERSVCMNTLSRTIAIVVSFVCTTMSVYGWGNATHVYVADHLGAKYPFQNTYELYGALLPDLYSYSFDTTGVFMHDLFHHSGGTIFAVAPNKDLKSIAFGFLSHNELYGADLTAHVSAKRNPGSGYMVVKGNELSPSLIPTLIDIMRTSGIDEGTATYVATLAAPTLGHDLCETAVDLLIKRQDDKLIGAKILAAATARPGETSRLLFTVYGSRLAAYDHISAAEAKSMLAADEAAYRKQIQQYGMLFCLPENTAIKQLGSIMAPIAAGFIEGAIGVAVTVTPAQAEMFIRKAMLIVAPDYQAEVKATIKAVEDRLNLAGITNTDSFSFGKEETNPLPDGRMPNVLATGVPTEFALAGNYPNPFNPTTTIKFSVAETRIVRLVVYDMLGREVAVLVNEVKEPGTYAVSWNGGMLSSGVYLCKMTSGNFMETSRMILQK